MKKIDVCLSPELIHLYDLQGRIVVIVDVLRASSTMVTALANGVHSIRAFASVHACKSMRRNGYIIAGERGGEKLAEFDLGNSPLNYLNEEYLGEKLAMTTTNGTLAIEKSSDAEQIIIGAFLNINAVAEYLKTQTNNVLIFCAGWKGKVNLEDTLFAGTLTEMLKDEFESECDAPLAASAIHRDSKGELFDYLKKSSHVQRLNRLGIEEDIKFCLTPNQYNIVPVLQGKDITIN